MHRPGSTSSLIFFTVTWLISCEGVLLLKGHLLPGYQLSVSSLLLIQLAVELFLPSSPAV